MTKSEAISILQDVQDQLDDNIYEKLLGTITTLADENSDLKSKANKSKALQLIREAVICVNPGPAISVDALKSIETRTWTTKHRGDLLIIAGLAFDHDYQSWAGVCRVCGCTQGRACPGGCSWSNDSYDVCDNCLERDALRGVILGIVDVAHCQPMLPHHEEFAHITPFPDGVSWFLRNIRRTKPLPVTGALSVFDIQTVNPNFTVDQLEIIERIDSPWDHHKFPVPPEQLFFPL